MNFYENNFNSTTQNMREINMFTNVKKNIQNKKKVETK